MHKRKVKRRTRKKRKIKKVKILNFLSFRNHNHQILKFQTKSEQRQYIGIRMVQLKIVRSKRKKRNTKIVFFKDWLNGKEE